AQAFESRFGLPLWQGYGLTEASPVVTSSVIGGVAKPGSVGVPVPGVEVRIIDEDGEDAFVGDSGELWVHGPNVFGGYWEDAAATAGVLSEDGWLRTGDVAVADDDGYLYLVDRSKDLIIVSGFNVFPAEVEDALGESPDVADVAVVGVADPETGEAVEAFVVPVSGRTPEADSLREWCQGRLARYKCPARVHIVDSLPRGMGGKLLRRALRDQA
ncbi:MAG: AMP-binding enzyme, partial [Acidimicrobiales bacterium]